MPEARIFEDFGKTLSVESAGGSDPGQLAKGRIDIDRLDESLARSVFGFARCRHDDWDSGSLLVVAVLAPHAMVAQVPTMISPKHDDGLFAQSVLVQALEQSTDLMIGETYGGQIPMDQFALKRFRKGALRRHVGVGPQFAAILQCETRRTGRRLLERSQCDLLRVVQIPVFFGCDKRQVRLEESDGKEPRLIG